MSFTSPDLFFQLFSVIKCLRIKKQLNSPDMTTVDEDRVSQNAIPQKSFLLSVYEDFLGLVQCQKRPSTVSKET